MSALPEVLHIVTLKDDAASTDARNLLNRIGAPFTEVVRSRSEVAGIDPRTLSNVEDPVKRLLACNAPFPLVYLEGQLIGSLPQLRDAVEGRLLKEIFLRHGIVLQC